MGNIVKIILKVGLIGIISLVVVFLICMAFFAWIVFSNNQEKSTKEEILKVNNSEAKKALLVYQPSKSKAARDIAHEIAKGLNDSGYEVVMEYPNKKLSNDVSKYSVLVFGSPVYVGQVSKALTNYMDRIGDFSGKKIVVYSVGSTQETKELETLEKPLGAVKPFIKVKLQSKDTKGAYELGKEAAKD